MPCRLALLGASILGVLLLTGAPTLGLAQYSSQTGLPVDVPPGAPALIGPVDEARVVLSCMLMRNGSLKDCDVVSEAPAGFEVAKTALKMAKTIKITPGDKFQAGSRIRVPVRFLIVDDVGPSPTSP